MLPGVKRGRTTQNRASPVSIRWAEASMSTFTSTCDRSLDSRTLCTEPSSTAL